ncbi:RNA-binding domain-containing protein [Tilletiaria anomala UBC 951]|uniref:Probable RNA-binding protein 18 n=1 Tax=Tilletiaria anomala (strain ATCC 24038 / CBS 436.72 / UBC 951) TaxID=1037660 RepID=A0A066WIF2_TILAU|nr:RNA-binding domain-containing protein [Tilletiaria anomala UBC 951]KDN53621.1 RNA-binding domain-containing protein [Tilletiaria anomala UBC 951]
MGDESSYELYISRPNASSSADSLDAISSLASSPRATSIPSLSKSAAATQRTKNSRRLYVGNLHPVVDEYLLVTTFSKYGKLSKIDFLFHKTGPLKGKPRGYAFIEYAKPEEALHALTATHDHTLRGRKLIVTFANNNYQDSGHNGSGTGPHRHHRDQSDAHLPTTLSLIKSASRPKGVDAKIAAMEAKLAALKGETTTGSAPASSTGHRNRSTPSTSSIASLKGHAALPRKPAIQGMPPKR